MLRVPMAALEEAVLSRAILLRLRTSACQVGIFFVVMWRRACLVRWSLRMNRRSHTGQTNFFSPVCVRRCRDSSSERANLLSQPSQLQLNGFSPSGGKQKDRQGKNMWVTLLSSKLDTSFLTKRWLHCRKHTDTQNTTCNFGSHHSRSQVSRKGLTCVCP